MWWLPPTSSYSYPRVVAIQIDVHLQGQTRPIWDIRFPCQSTYVGRTLPAGYPHMWQPFVMSSTVMDRASAPKKKGSRHNPQRVDWLIRGSIPSFSPEPAIEVVGVKPPSVRNQLLGLPGPYHRHVIGTFNTCPWLPASTGAGFGGSSSPCFSWPIAIRHIWATNISAMHGVQRVVRCMIMHNLPLLILTSHLLIYP
jgi:hypothetical protein